MNPDLNKLNTTLGQVSQTAGALDQDTRASVFNSLKGLSTTLDASRLGNTTPVTIAPTKPLTESAGLLASLTSLNDAQATEQAQATAQKLTATTDQAAQKKTAKDLFTALSEKLTGKATESGLQNKAYEEEGVDVAQKELNDINNQIRSKDLAYRRQIEKIRENPVGMSAGAINQEVGRIERQAASELADLSIIQQAKNDNYSSAREIADRKVKAELEQENNEIEGLKFQYEQIKGDLTRAEDQEFQVMISERERLLEQTANTKKAINDLALNALQNGAPTSLVQQAMKAGSEEEAIGLLGKYTNNQGNLGGGVGGVGGASSGMYSNDLDAIVGSVLSTIPTKFGQQTFKDQMAKARDDADKINLVAAQVLKGQPAEFKNDFRNQAVGISMIDKAIAELDAGAKTGVLQNTAQYTYNLAGKDFDPKLAKINGYITSAIQPYRNSVTGAAWGDQEDGEYQQLFGSTKYSPAELRQRLVQTKELLKSKSAEGLNAFVNPLGYYDNAFQTGTFAPDPLETETSTPTTAPVKSWFSGLGSWLFGEE